MRKPKFDEAWPDSWKSSYNYDLEEVFDTVTVHGYAHMYAQRLRHTLQMLKRFVPPPAKILDVAAAQGNFSLKLAEMGYDVTWNDLREELVDYVKLKHDRGQITYAPGNAFDLKFDVLFDAVIITEIIEHVAHPDEFLAEVARLVKPGGYIVMTTPNGGYFKNDLPKFSECPDPSQYESQQFKPNSDGHIFILHLDELKMLADRAHLKIIETRLFANFVTNGHMLTRYFLPFVPKNMVRSGESISRRLPGKLPEKLHSGMGVIFKRLIADEVGGSSQGSNGSE